MPEGLDDIISEFFSITAKDALDLPENAAIKLRVDGHLFEGEVSELLQDETFEALRFYYVEEYTDLYSLTNENPENQVLGSQLWCMESIGFVSLTALRVLKEFIYKTFNGAGGDFTGGSVAVCRKVANRPRMSQLGTDGRRIYRSGYHFAVTAQRFE